MSDTWISFNGNALSLNGYGLVVSGQNPYNPLNLPAYTVRFQFDDSSYDPTQVSGWKAGSAWTRVSTSPNIWDYYHNTVYWTEEFKDKFNNLSNTTHVLGCNLSGYIWGSTILRLFENCTALVDTGLLDVSGMMTIDSMFQGCSHLTQIQGMDTSNAVLAAGVFSYCSMLTTAPMFDTSKISDFSNAFQDCINLVSVPLYNLSNCTDIESIFSGCSSLQTTPLFDFSNVATMANAFANCTALSTVQPFNLSKVTNMRSAFAYCSNVQHLPVFNTAMVNNFNLAFRGMVSLLEVPLLTTTNAVNVSDMFRECRNVESGALALYTQMSTQAYPPNTYSGCFTACGRNSVTGAAELAQIPTSWGGTMA